ncbi:hypothetical protein [Chitinophaga sp. GbtcB8]|nr:hypothetical protein [Chitinophaga sp. GbtcB8]
MLAHQAAFPAMERLIHPTTTQITCVYREAKIGNTVNADTSSAY